MLLPSAWPTAASPFWFMLFFLRFFFLSPIGDDWPGGSLAAAPSRASEEWRKKSVETEICLSEKKVSFHCDHVLQLRPKSPVFVTVRDKSSLLTHC